MSELQPRFAFAVGERSACVRYDAFGKPILQIVDGTLVHAVRPRRGALTLMRWAREDRANRKCWHDVVTTITYLSDDLTIEERYRAQDACAHFGWNATAKALRMKLATLQQVVLDDRRRNRGTNKRKHHTVRAWLGTVGDVPRLPSRDPWKVVLCEVAHRHWRIPECPFCGSPHHHRCGPGHRIPHCRFQLPGRDHGYILAAAPQELSVTGSVCPHDKPQHASC